MKYLKVKPSADQRKRKDGSIYVANELYTEKEAENLGINPALCDRVEISRKKTYFFFGCRFATA
jgi:hypothetical protein